MSITTGMTATHLTRSQHWASELKEILQDQLDAQQWVNWLNEFPDGDNFTIPSVGEATVRDYVEDTSVVYDSLDSGEFQFNVTEYTSSATYITKKARQDAFYAAKLEASFVPKQFRALQERMESDVLSIADSSVQSKWAHAQADGDNLINGAKHRFVGTEGTRRLAIADFANALYALKRANVPDSNLIAIVDPSVEWDINTNTSITSFSNPNRQWDEIHTGGIATGMRFIKNIFGFDVYVSNYLSRLKATGTVGTAGDVQNIFFSNASPDINPFLGAVRQAPEVDSGFNKDKQREEYVTTSRYGLDLYRPENFVVAVTDPTVSY